MKYKVLYDVLPFLNDVDKERQKQFEEYFENAPLWIMDSFQIEELDENVIFVREKEPADTIYFIGKGLIKATEYRIYGQIYDFARFQRTISFGSLEFIMDLDCYAATLRTVTKCTVAKLPRAKFERWMYSDIHAMRREAKLISEYLLEAGRNSRYFLFLQGADRLAFLLIDRYEQLVKNGVLHIDDSRQDLADETGLCIKSVSRAVKKFQEDDLITREGNKILINERQYAGLKKIVDEKIDRS